MGSFWYSYDHEGTKNNGRKFRDVCSCKMALSTSATNWVKERVSNNPRQPFWREAARAMIPGQARAVVLTAGGALNVQATAPHAPLTIMLYRYQ